MRDNRTVKIELLSQWKLEAEFRNSYLRMKRRMPGDEGRLLPCITPPLCPGKTKGIETYFILCPKNATSLLPPHYPSVRAGGGQPEVTARVPIPHPPPREGTPHQICPDLSNLWSILYFIPI